MPSIPQPKVLCVDDDNDSREMLSALLRLSFIDTTAVATASEALSTIQKERFDLYLLDSQLPDLDGFELCRRMRKLDSQTPILFFSGDAYEVHKQQGLAAGANAYVSKPDIEKLIGSVIQFVFPAQLAVNA